jgi:hypothetical protein
MKTFTEPRPRFRSPEPLAVSRNPKLVGSWQNGIETMSGYAQRKLHFTLAHSPSPGVGER